MHDHSVMFPEVRGNGGNVEMSVGGRRAGPNYSVVTCGFCGAERSDAVAPDSPTSRVACSVGVVLARQAVTLLYHTGSSRYQVPSSARAWRIVMIGRGPWFP